MPDATEFQMLCGQYGGHCCGVATCPGSLEDETNTTIDETNTDIIMPAEEEEEDSPVAAQ